MNRATLNRFFDAGDSGIFGELLFDGKRVCFTKERPWENNEQYVSCIPDNLYQCMFIKSPKFGYTYQVLNVPYRFNILFHWGNYTRDTHGCILVGDSILIPDGADSEIMLLNSKKQHKRFLKLLKNTKGFVIEVKSPWNLII